jgi:hypothetical protein
MSNEFYTPTGNPATSSSGSSAVIRAEFAAIEDGFDKMPTITGNANEYLKVNSTPDGIESVAKDASGTIVGLTGYKINLKDVSGANLSYIQQANSASRTYTLPDRTGTLADNTDLALKANLASPNFIGVPTVPTAAAGTSTTQAASTAFVTAAVSASNPNIFINSAFEVNQEGYAADGVASLFVGSYGHDMIKAGIGPNTSVIYKKESDGDITIKSFINSDVVSRQSGIRQLSDEITSLVGETVTISLYVEAVDAPTIFRITGFQTTISSTGWASATGVVGSSPFLAILRDIPAGTTDTDEFRFNSLKIERGSVRTDYEVPEPRAEELRCFHYYYKITNNLSGFKHPCGFGVDTQIFMPTPVKMKDTVTMSTSGAAFTGHSDTTTTFPNIASFSNEVVDGAGVHASITVSGAGTVTGPSVMWPRQDGVLPYAIELDARP